ELADESVAAADAHVHLAYLLGPLVRRTIEPARLRGGIHPRAVHLRGVVVETPFEDEGAVLDGTCAGMHALLRLPDAKIRQIQLDAPRNPAPRERIDLVGACDS